jgi:flagella basal body P-ring formation protein FlgA
MSGVLIATVLATQGGGFPPPQVWLESRLRERYGAVREWRIRELRQQTGPDGVAIESAELGLVGARTLVIVHGHNRNGRASLEYRWYEVSGFAPAVITTRALQVRTTVSSEMLSVASVDVIAGHCEPLTDPMQAVGLRMLQSRREGETLCASMLGHVPAVERGGTVAVQVAVGRVALRTEAVARSDADIGERVQLYRAADRSYFWGTVSAPGEVQVR